MCLLRGTDWIFIYNSTFCPHSVITCFVWICEQTAIISLYNINWLVFITETEGVYCSVRTKTRTTVIQTWCAVKKNEQRLCAVCNREQRIIRFSTRAIGNSSWNFLCNYKIPIMKEKLYLQASSGLWIQDYGNMNYTFQIRECVDLAAETGR